jgi:hypothetical protein
MKHTLAVVDFNRPFRAASRAEADKPKLLG